MPFKEVHSENTKKSSWILIYNSRNFLKMEDKVGEILHKVKQKEAKENRTGRVQEN